MNQWTRVRESLCMCAGKCIIWLEQNFLWREILLVQNQRKKSKSKPINFVFYVCALLHTQQWHIRLASLDSNFYSYIIPNFRFFLELMVFFSEMKTETSSYAVFGFHQTRRCALWPDISTLLSSVQRTLFQKSCGLFRCNFAHVSCAALFFLERRWFLLATVPNKLYLYTNL